MERILRQDTYIFVESHNLYMHIELRMKMKHIGDERIIKRLMIINLFEIMIYGISFVRFIHGIHAS